MDIKIDSLIPFEKVKTEIDRVFSTVERNGKVLLIKDNQPAYIILKYDPEIQKIEKTANTPADNYTLQEAMRIVLRDAENQTMHASALAEEIYNRRLYLKKNGEKAEYNQIRARCGHYPDLFEAQPGNFIRLKEDLSG
ncbi:MAG: hypothetical protein HPY50_12925 [Firmicutes bacterium]|nr:hypothetical protein [Bacillota bacterium]